MNPLISLTQKIDDIDIYFEIYSSTVTQEDFSQIFSDGKFINRTDNILVMLHGNGEDSAIFKGNVEAFCHNDFCILVDSRGHGKSTLGENELTIDLMAEDISKLCDELNVGKFKLLGFSDGGNIALTYAIRHPERLSHLIIAGANLNPSGLKFSAKLSIFTSYLFAKPKRNKSYDDKLKFALLNLMVNHPHISLRLLKNIECKTFVIEGEKDLIKRSHTKMIAERIRNSKHEIVPHSGHNVFFENADYTNKIIKEFIS